nr:extracellular solute-binding protein [Propionibacterium sp.]
MRRITKAAIAFGAVFSLALAGCSSGAPATTPATTTPAGTGAAGQLPATTIKILAPSYSESSKTDWEKIITEFNKKQPNVKVELQIEGWDNFSSKVQARIQAKDYPDILNDNAFAGAAEAGLLYPITEVMSEATIKSIEPALLKNGTGADGKQWAAPDIASSRLLAYNTDLFAKAGVAAAPKTWAELEDAAKKIAALGGGVAGYGLPLGQEEAQVESSLWLWGAGGDWAVNGKLVANQPTAVEAFAQMKKLVDGGMTQPNAGATNRQQAADLFNNGKLGMMLSHSGLLKETREKFPQTKFDLAPIPSKSGTPVAFGVTDFIIAFDNKDANRKEATKQFLDIMYSDALYEGWYKGTGLLPVTTSQIAKGKASDTNNAKFYEALSYVKFLPVGNPQWDVLQKALQGTAGTITSDTPENVLKKIQAQVDAQG